MHTLTTRLPGPYTYLKFEIMQFIESKPHGITRTAFYRSLA